MVDTIKCQTEADLTEPFFKKLLLGAIDKSLDHEETVAAPNSSYNNYTHYPGQSSHMATGSEDRQQQDEGNPRADTWGVNQRSAESSHQSGQLHSAPGAATLNHPFNTPDRPHQPPRFFTNPTLGQTSEQQQQQTFPERSSPFPEGPSPNRLNRPFTVVLGTTEEPPASVRVPQHQRSSRGFGLEKFLQRH